MRTEPLAGGPDGAASGGGFAYRKRLDGGYTISQLGVNTYDVVPDSLRLMREFLPLARIRRSRLRLRVGRRFVEEWRLPRRWDPAGRSPFESVRVLDPEPAQPLLDEARDKMVAALPAFAGIRIAESWAGLIDVTPDVIPVISEVASLPGFFIATGFSGHGFGIGPGAGRLVADLVTGDPTLVDPTPFRFSRFAERPYPRPSAFAT
jgi:glycine/D-amino acid oxidase-like deaminating enzyme